MPRFLFSYRVPRTPARGESGRAWEAWFESLGSSCVDTGHGVIATRTLGKLDAETRLGGYSLVSAENIDGAAALAEGCPALRLGGGVEIGAVPEFIGNPRPEPMPEALKVRAVTRSGNGVLPGFGLPRDAARPSLTGRSAPAGWSSGSAPSSRSTASTWWSEAGTVLGLLGPNGAGKTTAVRILTTILSPTPGRRASSAYDVVAQAERGPDPHRAGRPVRGGRREPHRPREPPHGRPADHISRPGRRSARAEELLEQFGLTDAGDRPLKTYSGGMRRRLDLAAALVARPKVLFLDEPTTGLDPSSRATLWALIERARRRRHDRAAHHPVPRGGRPPGRPHRRGRPRPRHRRGDPRRSSRPTWAPPCSTSASPMPTSSAPAAGLLARPRSASPTGSRDDGRAAVDNGPGWPWRSCACSTSSHRPAPFHPRAQPRRRVPRSSPSRARRRGTATDGHAGAGGRRPRHHDKQEARCTTTASARDPADPSASAVPARDRSCAGPSPTP